RSLVGRVRVADRAERAGAIGDSGERNDQHWPRAGTIELSRQCLSRPACAWPRVSAGRRVILKIFIDRKTYFQGCARTNGLPGEGGAFANSPAQYRRRKHTDGRQKTDALGHPIVNPTLRECPM